MSREYWKRRLARSFAKLEDSDNRRRPNVLKEMCSRTLCTVNPFRYFQWKVTVRLNLCVTGAYRKFLFRLGVLPEASRSSFVLLLLLLPLSL